MSDNAEPRPASTVVLLRDGPSGLETLLLKRNKALMFAGGFWVFPGGALDSGDLAAADGDVELASRLAAAREAFEESGLRPEPENMVLVSHWTTPVVEPKRFSTWIYAAPVTGRDDVAIDGGEIHDHLWIAISEALARHRHGELAMLPPTLVTLLGLSGYGSVSELLTAERHTDVPRVLPVIAIEEDRMVVMFPGDAGYASGTPAACGGRHRAVLEGGQWLFSYCDVDPSFPSLVRQ